jgi:hypothetical protein
MEILQGKYLSHVVLVEEEGDPHRWEIAPRRNNDRGDRVLLRVLGAPGALVVQQAHNVLGVLVALKVLGVVPVPGAPPVLGVLRALVVLLGEKRNVLSRNPEVGTLPLKRRDARLLLKLEEDILILRGRKYILLLKPRDVRLLLPKRKEDKLPQN